MPSQAMRSQTERSGKRGARHNVQSLLDKQGAHLRLGCDATDQRLEVVARSAIHDRAMRRPARHTMPGMEDRPQVPFFRSRRGAAITTRRAG